MTTRTRLVVLAAASSVFLAACGGGGGVTIEVKALEAWRVAENTVIKAYDNTEEPGIMDLREAFDEVIADAQLHDYWHLLEKSPSSLEVQLWEPKPEDVIEHSSEGASEHRLIQSEEETTTSAPAKAEESSETTTTEPTSEATKEEEETTTTTHGAADSEHQSDTATSSKKSSESTKVLLQACIEYNGEEWESSNGACEGTHDDTHSDNEETAHSWSYKGETGPSNWGSISDQWLACEKGTSQSPIELGEAKGVNLPNPVFAYKKGVASVEDNGHTVVFTPESLNTVKIEETVWELKQMHYHAPGEHSVDGEKPSVEVHLVHQDESGHYLVVGLMLEGGGEKDSWGFVSQSEKTEIDWASLLPSDLRTVRYDGSLTTPPCSEGVKWVLMTAPVEVKESTITSFKAWHEDNNRPTQPTGDRLVEKDLTSDK